MSSAANSSDSDAQNKGNRGVADRPPPPRAKSNKKRKVVPPQDAIDKIWSCFSAPKFSRATHILPSAAPKVTSPKRSKATSPPATGLTNLLVSEDFERAVQECRTRVKKLIQECRRVNMRYRDPDFDIDWDLKWEKGYCLNGLGESKFQISGRSLSNSISNVPKAVKRVHELFDKPTFLKGQISPADIKQGTLSDCWLMASLTALANMEVGIQRICVEYDTKVGIYGFVFHRDGEWVIFIIDDKLYLKSPDWELRSLHRHLLEQTDREDAENEYRKTYQTGSQALFFAHCRDQNETWLPLLEKAYAKIHGDYTALARGWTGEGVEDLTGDGGYGSRDGITEGHAYVIMDARELSTGERLLKLRNPWGKGKKGNWEGAWSDGSKEFTPEAQRELNHAFGNDSVFWISYQDLLRKYQHFDRTRLFMDSPGWRLTQKWISIDVPWKAKFEQKFRIVLKQESPVVLVMSQLDDRYFEGLKGQYSFRLQFRLHNIDSLEEDDYIVRSHGNYLMERSVVTELKELPAGTYSIFMMVVADRDTSEPSVEDVIKGQCRSRVDNDKLAQVGAAYDTAHSKAVAYLTSMAAGQKAKNRSRARESRIAARKKNWERRHISREIMRKQERKNQEKREAKGAKGASEKNVKKEPKLKSQEIQTENIKEIATKNRVNQIQESAAPGIESSEPTTSELQTSQSGTDRAVQTEIIADILTDSGSADTQNSSLVEIFPLQLSPVSTNAVPQIQTPNLVYRDERRRPASTRRFYPLPRPPQYAVTSDGESSASPVSDYDELYSDDDPTLKPRPNNGHRNSAPTAESKTTESDHEDLPDPWNAVCIVGFRVYSKDEALKVYFYEHCLDGAAGMTDFADGDYRGNESDNEIDGGEEKHKIDSGSKKERRRTFSSAECGTSVTENDNIELPIR